MMMAKRTVAHTVLVSATLTLVACGSFGGSQFGDSRSDFNGRIYAGAGALISKVEPETEGDTTFSVDETQSAGGSLLLGYDLMPRLSIEGHYSTLGEATFNPSGSIGYDVAGVSALIYGLNDEADRTRREGFSVYGRIGGGAMQNEGDGVPFERVNDYHLLAGLGLEYGLSNGLGVRLEGVSHDLDAMYGQASLIYRFGDNERRRRPAPLPQPPAPEPVVQPEPEPTSTLIITDATPLDTDADGIVDTLDQCNDTPAGTPVGGTGCSYFDGVIEGIVFDTGSAVLTTDSLTKLQEVVDVLRRYPDTRIAISAHTDNEGGGEANLLLSKRRAVSVTRYLVEQGIDGARLTPRAYGESQPIQSNETAAGRSANRRVEFNLL
jgi:outer membrane protein OmpA-like peptidoglycan-associated protein